MRLSRTIAFGMVLTAAATPIFLSSLFLGGRCLIREIHWESDGGNRLQTLTLPVTSLEWYETDKELLVGERMFDVKSIAVEDGIAHVTGFFDDLETQLNRTLEDAGRTGQHGETSGLRLFQACLGILGIPAESVCLTNRPTARQAAALSKDPSIHLSNGHRRIPIPPPQTPS